MTTWKPQPPKLALYGRENEGKGRAYRDPFTGKTYPSVTNVLGLEDKSALIQWAVDRAVEWCVENPDKLMIDPEDAFKRARYRHNDTRNERAWVGTGVHEAIRSELEGDFEFIPLDDEQEQILEAWNDFQDHYEIIGAETESTVLNESAGWAGTLDLQCTLVDRLTGETFDAILDFKTSKNIWPSHFMQVSALNRAEWKFKEVEAGTEGARKQQFTNVKTGKKEWAWWVKLPFQRAGGHRVLHLRADGWNLLEIEDVELHYANFLNYLAIFNNSAAIKAAEKERNKAYEYLV